MSNYRIYWYDEAHSILVMEINPDEWSWDDAYSMLIEFKSTAESVSHPIYTVLWFQKLPPAPPGNFYHEVKRLMDLRAKNEAITVFAGVTGLFRLTLSIVSNVFFLRKVFKDFRFAGSLEQAINLIEQDRLKAG